jgi:hypothetical protein
MKFIAKFLPRRDGTFGKVFDKQINADGTIEADTDEFAAKLLATKNFEKYTVNSLEELEPKKPVEVVTMIITNADGETIDLMTLGKEELLWLGREELELDVNGRNSEETLRNAIFAHVSKAPEEIEE